MPTSSRLFCMSKIRMFSFQRFVVVTGTLSKLALTPNWILERRVWPRKHGSKIPSAIELRVYEAVVNMP